MKIPNSPAEFIKGCLDGALEELGDDSQVTIPTANLKQLVDGYWQTMRLVVEQQKLINALIDDD